MPRFLLLAAVAGAVVMAQLVAPAQESSTAPAAAPRQPNVVVVLTDDQSSDTLPSTPAAMPWLQAQLAAPTSGWIRFPNTFANTPLCCPARATLLSGRYAHNTGVQSNVDGPRFDDASTVATWLHGAGYWTGLVGKYLNGYPWQRGNIVPPGWDRFYGKSDRFDEYYNYTLNENGTTMAYGSSPADYSTDVYARKAGDFIRSAPADRPFLLWLATNAPHGPPTPPPRYLGLYDDAPPVRRPSFNEADVSDKPAWVRALPRISAAETRAIDAYRRDSYGTLRAVDDAVAEVSAAVAARGATDNTLIFFLTDNGYAFGNHRWWTPGQWAAKRCAYDVCARVPLVVRVPGQRSRKDGRLLTNADLAPTIAALAGTAPGGSVDGRSLVGGLYGGAAPPRSGVLLEWASDGPNDDVPAYWAVRTKDYLYVELSTQEVELYDLTGRLGRADPHQLENRATQASYGAKRAELAQLLRQLKAESGARASAANRPVGRVGAAADPAAADAGRAAWSDG